MRVDSYGTYQTIRSDYINRDATGVFLDTIFSGGASYDLVDLFPWDRCTTSVKEIEVGHYEGDTPVIDFYITNQADTIAAGSLVEPFDTCSSRVVP